MQPHPAKLTRRQFLQLAGLAGFSGSLSRGLRYQSENAASWPKLDLSQLPAQMQTILRLVPAISINPAGIFVLHDGAATAGQPLPLAQTQWNREHPKPWDRLSTGKPWAIVLHWYGDDSSFDRSLEGYLRGFDAQRRVNWWGPSYTTNTSAHVLVGGGSLDSSRLATAQAIGILATQAPDADGTPFTASHLQPLDYQAHSEKRQYFVRALYELEQRRQGSHSILQDWFDGPRQDANQVSLAIELTGGAFEAPGRAPSSQQVANSLAVVMALMQRYNIHASDVLGHHEIQIDKPDPGKPFMTSIRCLLAAHALWKGNPRLNELVFYASQHGDREPASAVEAYLRWVWDYFVLVSRPGQVKAWDESSGYWSLWQALGDSHILPLPSGNHPD